MGSTSLGIPVASDQLAEPLILRAVASEFLVPVQLRGEVGEEPGALLDQPDGLGGMGPLIHDGGEVGRDHGLALSIGDVVGEAARQGLIVREGPAKDGLGLGALPRLARGPRPGYCGRSPGRRVSGIHR